MRKIESYSFGQIQIDGKKYSSDVIIRPHKVQDHWWRNSGHQLALDDIRKVIDEDNPSILVVGTGKLGVMKVLPETEEFLNQRGIRCLIQKTDQACKTFNELGEQETVVGAFHLTC